MKALILTLALFPFIAQARDVETAPDAGEKIDPPPEKVSITLATADEKTLTLRMENRTGKPFTYSGYSPESPIFQIKEHPVGWCGTGVRAHSLESGNFVTFKVGRFMLTEVKADAIHVTVGGVTSAPIPIRK